MDLWTLVVGGLVVLPIVGLLVVLADLVDAYNDLILVRAYRPAPSVEEEQARHTLWAQIARAVSLVLIVVMATSELLDVLNRDGIAAILYLIVVVLVGDAYRSRRARKRMISLLTVEPTKEGPEGPGA